VIGWLAAICFSLCAVPLAWDGLRGQSKPMNAVFVGLWFFGEVCGILYTLERTDWPLFTQYVINLICLVLYLGGLPNEQRD
jgi:hypothetical protein